MLNFMKIIQNKDENNSLLRVMLARRTSANAEDHDDVTHSVI